MLEDEVSSSDIFLKPLIIFEQNKKYLIQANSGTGKTSLLNFIYGNNKNYSGKIFLESTDLIQCRQTKLSYVFQDFKLFPELTLYENIKIKNDLTKHKSKAEINDLIEVVGLSSKRNHLFKQLSLGQKQKTAIIRSFCQPFDFILLDEPFSHLDNENIKIISKLINKEILLNNSGLILTSLGNQYFFKYDMIFNL